MRTWRPHKNRLSALAFSPDGRLLATTAGQSKLVWLWDALTGTLVRRLAGNEFPARAVAFSPCGRFLAGMQAGPSLNVWNLEDGKLFANLWLTSGGSKTLAFSPDGESLVAPGNGGLSRWSGFAGSTPQNITGGVVAIRGAKERVGFSPSGRLVIGGEGLVAIRPWDGPEEAVRTFDTPVGYQSVVNGFAFDREEKRLAVAYGNQVAAVWDLTQPGARPVLLEGHKKHVRAVGFTPDGRTVITVGLDGTSRFWDASTGQCSRVLEWDIGSLTVAAFSPDGLTCAAGGENGQVVVWDVDA